MSGPWWFGEGPIEPPPLSDKLVDWQALAVVGGQPWLAGKAVLDVGPGYALEAQVFSGLAARWVVLDLAPRVLARVAEVAPRALRVQGDACAMPFGPATFDVVLDCGTFDNTPDPGLAYREAARVLRSRGVLISTYANRRVLGGAVSPDGAERRQDPDELARWLNGCGLDVRWRDREDQARAVMVGEKP